MRTVGANVVMLRDGKVLLTKREDFHVWCLPGGHMEPGESFAHAAVREAREETGLDVRLTRLVGLYSRPRWGEYHIAVFAAEPAGGSLHGQVGEVIDLAFFGREALPEGLVIGHRQRILDALDGRSGVWREEYAMPDGFPASRDALYRLRDESGLSREQFYRRYFMPLEGAENVLEVGVSEGRREEIVDQ